MIASSCLVSRPWVHDAGTYVNVPSVIHYCAIRNHKSDHSHAVPGQRMRLRIQSVVTSPAAVTSRRYDLSYESPAFHQSFQIRFGEPKSLVKSIRSWLLKARLHQYNIVCVLYISRRKMVPQFGYARKTFGNCFLSRPRFTMVSATLAKIITPSLSNKRHQTHHFNITIRSFS